MLCDEKKFREYEEHYIQKAFRKLDREFRAGDIKMSVQFSGKSNWDGNSKLKSAVEKYTTKRGREDTNFLRLSIPEKLQFIKKNSKANIGFFLHYQTLFYEDGSEAMHGSFYGTIFHLGAAMPEFDPKKVGDANIHIQKMLSLFLLDIGTLIHQLLIVVSKHEKIQEVLDGSQHNLDMAGKILEIAMKDEKEATSKGSTKPYKESFRSVTALLAS